jgi:hypothetical protein
MPEEMIKPKSRKEFKPTRTSLVDTLAEKLSELTGTKFTVVREEQIYSNQIFQPSVITRYRLRAEIGVHTRTFGTYRGLTANEMKFYISSICDMIEMGFVPVSKLQLWSRSR